MEHFSAWYYTAHNGTILYGWACFRLAFNTWKFLIFHSGKYSEKDIEITRIRFFEGLDLYSVTDDIIRNYHLHLQ